ncbi:MAG: DUF2062 domain-containing protein [Deltaproteobacteria bacterium]|nr:DUF2062 domain-containing protein [Deltaproteobacteria bacterium]
MSLFENFYKKLKSVYYQFVRLRATPEEVSRGLALGVFVGMTPTYGFQVVLAILLAVALKENKLAAVLGVFVTNPFTAIPIYYFNYRIGRLFVPSLTERLTTLESLSVKEQLSHLANASVDFLLVWLLGCLIVGLISALLTYWISKPIYIYLRDKKRIFSEKRAMKDESSEISSE